MLTPMSQEERKAIVAQLLKQGRSLSEILDHLHKEKGDSITYMDLRLLLSEMPEATLPEKDPPKPVILPPDKPSATPSPDGGKLSISMDQMPAPGSMLSGYARFSSGAKAHWFLDEMGRLGLEPELGSGKATEADLKEFSAKLRQMLQQAGGRI